MGLKHEVARKQKKKMQQSIIIIVMLIGLLIAGAVVVILYIGTQDVTQNVQISELSQERSNTNTFNYPDIWDTKKLPKLNGASVIGVELDGKSNGARVTISTKQTISDIIQFYEKQLSTQGFAPVSRDEPDPEKTVTATITPSFEATYTNSLNELFEIKIFSKEATREIELVFSSGL